MTATKGQVLTYGGKVAAAVYSSSTGGLSQSAADAWGGGAPYLVSVKDPYDTIAPYHNWGPVFVTGKDLAAALKLSGKPLDASVTRNASKRVVHLVLTAQAHGSQSDVSATGTAVAVALNLRSLWFSVGVLCSCRRRRTLAVNSGTKVTLGGIVRGVKGVALQQRKPGRDWTDVGPVTPDPTTGAISIDVTPTATTDYRLATATAAAAPVEIRVN